MNKDTMERIAAMVAKAGGDCPCNCHDPAVCEVSEPFNHHDCAECWAALIGEMCSPPEAREAAVWAVLVGICGASPDQRDDFVYHALRTHRLEYRFQGHLGFGGKVHMGGEFTGDSPRVSCYKEDETQRRRTIIDGANALLTAIARI